MIEAIGLCLPVYNIDFDKIFRGQGRYIENIPDSQNFIIYEILMDDSVVTINIDKSYISPELISHFGQDGVYENSPVNTLGENLVKYLKSLRSYFSNCRNRYSAKKNAFILINRTKLSVGITFNPPVNFHSKQFKVVRDIAFSLKSFLVVHDSIYYDGRFIAGELAEKVVTATSINDTVAPKYKINSVQYKYQLTDKYINYPHELAQREKHMALLAEYGFKVSKVLPIDTHLNLRPIDNLIEQLGVLVLKYLWATTNSELLSDQVLHNFRRLNINEQSLSPQDREILDTDRKSANENYATKIGWVIENIISLAWILGFEHKPRFFAGNTEQPVINHLFQSFLPLSETVTLKEHFKNIQPRTESEIKELHDIFYCALNAARSAYTGDVLLPEIYDPTNMVGSIQEIYHSLQWALAPNTTWEQTELSA